MGEPNQFVNDGYGRLCNEHEPAIRAEVELEFADQMENASWFQRRRIRKIMKREIQSRLDAVIPPEALY